MAEDNVGRQSGRGITVDEAARHLGLSVDAVRKRVQRGQIAHENDLAGRVHILLDETETIQDKGPDTTGQQGELLDELRDRIRYLERQVEEERDARRRADTLLAQLMQRIPELEPPAPPESPEPREPGPHRVRPERAEPAEPVDPRREEPERVEPERVEPERVEPREPSVRHGATRTPTDASLGQQEGTEPRPWWRRMFGGGIGR